jgi:pyruvate dehydrogenase E2 component (dihydrolipoamide acetyltransferase)
MATLIRMPEVLANATEAVLLNWIKKVGDAIAEGDELAEIETDKAVVTLEAELGGILATIIANEGDSVLVGSPIAVIAAVGDSAEDIERAAGVGSADRGAPVMPKSSDDEPATSADVFPMPSPVGPTDSYSRIFTSPLARKIANDRAIDIASIHGTGPGGRIVRSDVERTSSEMRQEVSIAAATISPVTAVTAISPVKIPTTPAGSVGKSYADIPHTPMRRAIARRLVESKTQVPHFYIDADIRVDELLALREKVNATSPRRLSFNDFVVKAVAQALVEVPEMNVIWTDAAVRRFESIDIAVAVATDGGLLTPVIRGAEGKTITGISEEIAELATRARAGRLKQYEIEGGAFSVTNLGMYGTKRFVAIINPPQAGIMAVGAAQRQPVVVGELVSIMNVVSCTLSADHRAVDGALAAQFMASFVRFMENPITILI